jgi:hypothetical protein
MCSPWMCVSETLNRLAVSQANGEVVARAVRSIAVRLWVIVAGLIAAYIAVRLGWV